jgi:hypothetical protein
MGKLTNKDEGRDGTISKGSMPEIDSLTMASDRFRLDFLEREATPEGAMQFNIRLHLAGLSLSDTVSILETPVSSVRV